MIGISKSANFFGRFSLHGLKESINIFYRRIKRRETPQTLELEQNDIIDIFFEQTGGNGYTSPTEES